MNLVELQKIAQSRGDNMSDTIIANFLENDGFFGAMQFNTFGGSFAYGWNEEKTLPTASSRALNADYTASSGETKQMQEALKVYGGKIQVDSVMANQLGVEVVMKKQESQMKAIRLKIVNDFFNGSSASDITAFDGLKAQIPTTVAGRIEKGYVVANGGGALSRTKLDELIGNTDVDANSVIFADKMVPFYINQYGESLVSFDKNEFGVPQARYGDIPIITVDRNNLNAKILGFGEAGSTSSLFLTSLDIDKVSMLSGSAGMVSKSTSSGSIDSYQVDWLLALAIQGQYNAGRLSGFTAATMVA